jgi:RHS repeat-associated protein
MKNRTILCRYSYDALDRLVASTAWSDKAPRNCFYLKNRLTSVIQDAVQYSVMQHQDYLLAQKEHLTGAFKTHLLFTDRQRSVLTLCGMTPARSCTYTPYGYREPSDSELGGLQFNGESRDPVTGCYMLGNGYRVFNPVLMRFTTPDSWSPLGTGGRNAYQYCLGDPVNNIDPSGHAALSLSQFISRLLKNNPRPRIRQVSSALPLNSGAGPLPKLDPLTTLGPKNNVPEMTLKRLAADRVHYDDFLKVGKTSRAVNKLDAHNIKAIGMYSDDPLKVNIPDPKSWVPLEAQQQRIVEGYQLFRSNINNVVNQMDEVFKAYPSGDRILPSAVKSAAEYAQRLRQG